MTPKYSFHLDHFLLALALTFPVYILTFVGMKPITQGFAYLPYALIFLYFWYRSSNLFFSKKFIFFWVIFLAAWIIPSVINAYSGRLESDLVRLPVLFVHVAYMTMLLLSYGMYLSLNDNQSLKKLLLNISFMLSPLLIILFIKTLLLEYDHPELRHSPFGASPHFVGEILLVFVFGVLFTKTYWVKAFIFFITLLFLILLENRTGMIAFLILLGGLSLRWLFSNYNERVDRKKFAIVLIGIILFLIPFYQMIYNFVDQHIFYITSQSRGLGSGFTWRSIPWERAYESILTRPFLGVGFWVKPYGYELTHYLHWFSTQGPFYNNPNYEIHSAWIRIFAENGLVLFSIIMSLLLIVIIKCIVRRDLIILLIILSIMFYLSFVTRHLTLNLMNATLYMLILRTLFQDRFRLT